MTRNSHDDFDADDAGRKPYEELTADMESYEHRPLPTNVRPKGDGVYKIINEVVGLMVRGSRSYGDSRDQHATTNDPGLYDQNALRHPHHED